MGLLFLFSFSFSYYSGYFLLIGWTMYYVEISLIFLCILHDELFISFYSIFSVFLGLQVYVAKNFFSIIWRDLLYILYTFTGKKLISFQYFLYFFLFKTTLLTTSKMGKKKKALKRKNENTIGSLRYVCPTRDSFQ